MELFLNLFTEFAEFSNKKKMSLYGLEPATSSIRDQDVTAAPTRHISPCRNFSNFFLKGQDQ